MNLQIGPLNVPVVEVDLTAEETWGEFWCLPVPQIRVNQELPKDLKALTILHEVLECITEIFGLGLSESDIRTLEMSLAKIIRENPEEFREWLRMLDGGDLGITEQTQERH